MYKKGLALGGGLFVAVGLVVWRILSFRSPEAYLAVWERFRDDLPLILLLLLIVSAPLYFPSGRLKRLMKRGGVEEGEGKLSPGARWTLGVIGIGFLTFQAVMILHGRFSDYRYYNWAPHDSQSEYVISVQVDGRELEADEVNRRYRKHAVGVEARAIAHLIRLVRQHEMTYGLEDDATVTIRWRTNGGEEQEWGWPQP